MALFNQFKNKQNRIAWLLPSVFYYWHPFLCEFTKLFPDTKVFAGRWYGFAQGYEESFAVEVVGGRRVISIISSNSGYGYNITYVPLNILTYLVKFKPDIIFSNSFGIWSVLALMFKFLFRWKVLIAYEGSSPSVDYQNSTVRLLFRKILVGLSDGFITNSHTGKLYLTNILHVRNDRILVHPYEVPSVNAFNNGSNSKLGLTHEIVKPCFVYIGSVSHRKGLKFLLKACYILAKLENHRFTMMIVGDGSQKKSLEEYCANHQLSSCVKWVGRVEYQELGSYLNLADVFILPTLEDTWGMVILESMVMAKPVLCSKFAGTSELIAHGKNGYCFDPNNTEELVGFMRQFITDPGLSLSIGRGAHDSMSSYSPESAARQCAGFIAKIF